MKHQAILGNIGHFDDEIEMAPLERDPKMPAGSTSSRRSTNSSSRTGHSIIVLSEGRLLNLGNATGHPSFVMSNSFSNQVIAQIELWTKNDEYDNEVYRLAKHLDEKVAKIHVEALGGSLTRLTKEQAEYINVDVDGPYKPEHYRLTEQHIETRADLQRRRRDHRLVLQFEEAHRTTGDARVRPG